MPSEKPVPLSVLDLVPLTSGSTAGDALRNVFDLARHVERFGYVRYWLAEHHLTPSVVSAAPAVLIALVAAATQRIRVGSGAVQTAYQTPVVTAEQFGTIAHIHPGRIDLGLGRSSVGRFIGGAADTATSPAVGPSATDGQPASRPRVVDGLLITTITPTGSGPTNCSPRPGRSPPDGSHPGDPHPFPGVLLPRCCRDLVVRLSHPAADQRVPAEILAGSTSV
ncbi:LLM class flavin-dependent oxidoreductase [Protofrankia coriariae]|uniref:LLM class flavin-dependent oxidoreductase n=1 Tax=Protofrankia coriariae TaxID=1562887 RepID=UPI000A32956E